MCSPNTGSVQSSDVTDKFTHAQVDITAGKSGVAAETVELVLQSLGCFPIQDSVYSLPLRTKH